MSSPMTIWTEDTTVRTSDTDFLQCWKLSGFFSAMQEIASHHASHLGYDYRGMLANDMIWVLSRAKIRFDDFPLMGETVRVTTWPKGLQQKVFFMRDFLLNGGDGRPLAAASLAFVLINTRARRILMPTSLNGSIPDNGGKFALDEPLEKISPAEELEDLFTVQAGYSVVDLMGHVNNARYIDWISDCFSFEEHNAARPGWMQINYLNEVRPGEQVSLARSARANDPRAWYICGTNQSSGVKAFEAELHWQD